jgi:hypothetical protein
VGSFTAGSSKEQRLSRLRAGATAQPWRPSSARRTTETPAEPHLWRGVALVAAAAHKVKGDSFDVNTSVMRHHAKPATAAASQRRDVALISQRLAPKSPRMQGRATHSVVRARTMPFLR